jgi:Ca2+/Na+ antiporter
MAEKLFGRYVSETNRNALWKILAFAAIVEAGTGLVLIIDPAIVVALLLGAEVSGVGALLGRCFGVALLAVGLACWPGRQRAESGSPAFRAMLIYNALIALYLAYVGTVGHLGGVLLWPGVALHAVVALLLVWTWRDERRTKATDK